MDVKVNWAAKKGNHGWMPIDANLERLDSLVKAFGIRVNSCEFAIGSRKSRADQSRLRLRIFSFSR